MIVFTQEEGMPIYLTNEKTIQVIGPVIPILSTYVPPVEPSGAGGSFTFVG